MFGYNELAAVPEERERLEALKALPALQRQLDKIERGLCFDKRVPGWDREAEQLGISERLSDAAAAAEHCCCADTA